MIPKRALQTMKCEVARMLKLTGEEGVAHVCMCVCTCLCIQRAG